MKTLRLAALLLLAAWPAWADYKATILADNPQGYWRLDEASGAAVNLGSVGSGGNGTVNNSPTRSVVSAGGPAYDANPGMTFTAASSQSVTIADNNAWSPNDGAFGNDMTIEVVTSGVTSGAVASKGGASSYEWGMTASLVIAWAQAGGTICSVTATNAVAAACGSNLCHTVGILRGFSVNSVTTDIVLNGTRTNGGCSAGKGTKGSNAVRIGGQDDNAAFLTGTVLEVAIWDSLLTDAQIARHYKVWSNQIRRRRAALDDLLSPPVMQFARGLVPQPWLIAALRGEP